MSYVRNLIDDVNASHIGLGNLVAVCQIILKAKKMALIVSPSGCGKSVAMDFSTIGLKNKIAPDRLSMAGLKGLEKALNDFEGAIVVDDISTTGTDYARIAIIGVLVALVYTHHVESFMVGSEYDIQNFNGSALVGVQPVWLKNLMLDGQWEGSIQDKCLRYYHLVRPTSPNLILPSAQIESGIEFNLVRDFTPDVENIYWKKLVQLGIMQWSKARCKQHLIDYLKAISALEGRDVVEADDYEVLENLLRPMAFETIATVKYDFEGEKKLDNNLLALVTEYNTYRGQFSLAQVAMDYKLTVDHCYKIMKGQSLYWEQISKSPTIYKPSKSFIETLKKYKLEIEND
jgi:hypothetical protein